MQKWYLCIHGLFLWLVEDDELDVEGGRDE